MASNEIIDQKVISELKSIMGDDYLAVYDAFIRSGDKYISELQDAVNTNDLVSIEKISHTLKGSSANIGARKFSELCKLLLEKSRNSDEGGFADLLEKINNEYICVKNVIEEIINA